MRASKNSLQFTEHSLQLVTKTLFQEFVLNLSKKHVSKNNFLIVLISVISGISSCGPNSFKPDLSNTPTSGNLKVSCDESFKPLMQAQADTYTTLYQNAHVNITYKTETEAINDLLNDSCKVIIVSKELTAEQTNYFKSKTVVVRPLKIAVDAVALIVNKSNPDSLLKLSQFNDILNGKINSWNAITKENAAGTISVVFDKAGSANARFLKEKFLGDKNFPANCFAVKSNKEVIDYVSKQKNAIGVIGVNWISDEEDTTAMSFYKQIKVIAMSNDTAIDKEYYLPYQAYIPLNQYPLTRDVYLINRESSNGIGTGFASFVAGDQGQRLVRLKGLLPATMPVRLIKVK